MNKKLFALLCGVGMMGAAFAEGEPAAGFDPATFLTTATTTVTGIVTAVGTLLAAVFGLYLAYLGYRKGREAVNKA